MKKPWQSKTIIVNFIVAAAALFYPPAHEWVQAHPMEISSLFAIVNVVLRLVTKDKISILE